MVADEGRLHAGSVCNLCLSRSSRTPVPNPFRRRPGGRAAALPNHSGVLPIEGTKWCCFWLSLKHALAHGISQTTTVFSRYPFVCRVAADRYIIASTDSKFVDSFLEHAGLAGITDSPRILVDKATRELVFPPPTPREIHAVESTRLAPSMEPSRGMLERCGTSRSLATTWPRPPFSVTHFRRLPSRA